MGRISEIVSFLNSRYIPTGIEWLTKYTHIDKTVELMRARREYQKKMRDEKNNSTKLDFDDSK